MGFSWSKLLRWGTKYYALQDEYKRFKTAWPYIKDDIKPVLTEIDDAVQQIIAANLDRQGVKDLLGFYNRTKNILSKEFTW